VSPAAQEAAEGTTHPLRLEQYRTTLRDGTPVLVRPISPDDKNLIRQGFDRLSTASRYRRFLAPIDELSDAELRYLTEIDYVDHFAWAAVRADLPNEGMGVARYIRLKEEPEVAEAAVTVIDEYQGKGLGTLLLALLGSAALAAGIRTFRAYVLEGNVPMRDLLETFGARTEFDSPGVVRFDVPLDPSLLPESPAGNVLRAVAQHVVGPIAFPSPN
jgi:GNAT superfamily N-acetyltransferase